MFSITPTAAEQIQLTAAQSGANDLVLRFAARHHPDGSYEFGMGFDKARDGDVKLNLHDVAVVYEPEYGDALEETVLDYVEMNPGEFNFIFMDSNPTPAAPMSSGGGCGSGGCGSGGCGSQRGCQ
jgi:iron-sulfur cluster assembly protein